LLSNFKPSKAAFMIHNDPYELLLIHNSLCLSGSFLHPFASFSQVIILRYKPSGLYIDLLWRNVSGEDSTLKDSWET
jgi:hypothetical protein